MKNYIIVIVLLLSQWEGVIASPSNTEIIERSIGKLLLSHDQKFSYQNDLNPFGSAILYDELVKLFNSDIKSLPKEERVNFLWSAMWHLSFDGHVMMQFQMLVAEDCGELFVSRLQKYIEIESELQRSKSRLYLSQKVLSGIKAIMSIKTD